MNHYDADMSGTKNKTNLSINQKRSTSVARGKKRCERSELSISIITTGTPNTGKLVPLITHNMAEAKGIPEGSAPQPGWDAAATVPIDELPFDGKKTHTHKMYHADHMPSREPGGEGAAAMRERLMRIVEHHATCTSSPFVALAQARAKAHANVGAAGGAQAPFNSAGGSAPSPISKASRASAVGVGKAAKPKRERKVL